VIKLSVTSVFVDDQAKALDFYTGVLGFEKRQDIPMGEYRWLTVSGAGQDVDLLLEPDANPIAQTYKTSLAAAGIPMMIFSTDDIHAEYERLTGLGVEFTGEPQAMGPVTTATFNDTCGNLIRLVQLAG
jgi:catechol 2,3-dioxygenase-like lactoylglutathione lyase family enzyme